MNGLESEIDLLILAIATPDNAGERHDDHVASGGVRVRTEARWTVRATDPALISSAWWGGDARADAHGRQPSSGAAQHERRPEKSRNGELPTGPRNEDDAEERGGGGQKMIPSDKDMM